MRGCTAWHHDHHLSAERTQPLLMSDAAATQVEATAIIRRLNPEHINGWTSLADILREAAEAVRKKAESVNTPTLTPR